MTRNFSRILGHVDEWTRAPHISKQKVIDSCCPKNHAEMTFIIVDVAITISVLDNPGDNSAAVIRMWLKVKYVQRVSKHSAHLCSPRNLK